MSYIKPEVADYLARAVYAMEQSGKSYYYPEDVRLGSLSWCGNTHDGAIDYLIANQLASRTLNGGIDLTSDARSIGEKALTINNIPHGNPPAS